MFISIQTIFILSNRLFSLNSYLHYRVLLLSRIWKNVARFQSCSETRWLVCGKQSIVLSSKSTPINFNIFIYFVFMCSFTRQCGGCNLNLLLLIHGTHSTRMTLSKCKWHVNDINYMALYFIKLCECGLSVKATIANSALLGRS